jgi:hypothetical protein
LQDLGFSAAGRKVSVTAGIIEHLFSVLLGSLRALDRETTLSP